MKVSLNIEVLKSSHIPRRFWALDVKTYSGDKTALKLARNYIKNFELALDVTQSSGVGLFFIGKTASFKTFLATLILKSLIVRGYDVSYWTLDTLHHARCKKETSFEDLLTQDQCVVFDNANITTTNTTGGSYLINTFRKAIQIRSDNALPYLVCTSLELEVFEQHYGTDVTNRLKTDLVKVDCDSVFNHESWERRIHERKAPFKPTYA